MKFNNYLWNNYLQTKEGKNAITDFSFDEKEPSELDVTFRYNKQLKALFGTKKRMEVVTYVMDSFSNCLICNLIPPQTEQEAFAIYDYILEEGVNDTVQGRDYEMSLQTNTWISWLFGVEVKKIGGDTGYAGTGNRDFCKENKINFAANCIIFIRINHFAVSMQNG